MSDTRAFDRRNHIDGATVPMDRAHLLALANPLAALRQRDALHGASQLGSEVIHADADQVGALAQCPGVSGVIAEIFRYGETGD